MAEDEQVRRCPDCENNSFKVDAELEAECLVCHTKQDRVWFCESCDELILDGGEYDMDGVVRCESCVYRERDYGQHMEDVLMERRRESG